MSGKTLLPERCLLLYCFQMGGIAFTDCCMCFDLVSDLQWENRLPGITGRIRRLSVPATRIKSPPLRAKRGISRHLQRLTKRALAHSINIALGFCCR